MAPSDAQSVTRLICAPRRDRPSHEPLPPEGAARVDAACDRAGAGNSTTRTLHRRRTDPPAARPADWPSIPGLELVEALGSGGMGVVFRARQASLDRDVAVKFLRDAHRADAEQRERFLQEARAVARLRHPNLVQVYECGEVPAAGGAASQPYLVLEYVSGGSLADLLRGAPQPPAEAARLIEALADAIHYAHQQGVIHRDLKPANVLLVGNREQGTGNREEGTSSLFPVPCSLRSPTSAWPSSSPAAT